MERHYCKGSGKRVPPPPVAPQQDPDTLSGVGKSLSSLEVPRRATMIRVAAVQDAPVFLNRAATTEKILDWMAKAAQDEVRVIAFPETFLPGYPFWLSLTGGARFDDPLQKEAYRAYLDAAPRLDGPELSRIAKAAADLALFVVLGIAERGPGSGSIYCTLVPIDPMRGILTTHIRQAEAEGKKGKDNSLHFWNLNNGVCCRSPQTSKERRWRFAATTRVKPPTCTC